MNSLSPSPLPTPPNGTCYSITNRASPWPSNPYTYIPCNLTALSLGQHSACCAPGDTCLTNGLCKYNPPPTQPLQTFNSYWRIGCTDPTYQDPACPRQCKNVEDVERHVHIVFQCPGEGQWCCGTGRTTEYADTLGVNTTCCDDRELAFGEGEGAAGKAYTTAREGWASEVVIKSAVVVSVGESTTGSVSAKATAVASGDEAASASATVSGGGAAPATVTGNSGLPSLEPAKSSPVALGVGIGIGIPVLVGLIVAVSLWLYRSRRKRGDFMVELSDNDVGRDNPHAFTVEKSGREVPAELGADTGPFEVWTPQDKRLDFDRGRAEGYR